MTSEAELGLRDRLAKLQRRQAAARNAALGRARAPAAAARASQGGHLRRGDLGRVELARHQERPYTLDYVERILDDFFELHGDRGRMDDHAIVTGIGKLEGRTVALIGHQKGRDLKERTRRNFGMAYPEGYRKAMRVMELADRHGFPLLTLVDTPGAYPGVAAEQHGQGGAIARSQAVMARLDVPTVSVVIGEGGSGGAVAIAVADRVLMQENAIYSVISPEGCAAILWRDASQAKKAASAFRLDAAHCLDLGVIDGIVPEPAGGAHDGRRGGGAAPARRRRLAPRRARRDRAGRAPPRPPREVPRHGRLRLGQPPPRRRCGKAAPEVRRRPDGASRPGAEDQRGRCRTTAVFLPRRDSDEREELDGRVDRLRRDRDADHRLHRLLPGPDRPA